MLYPPLVYHACYSQLELPARHRYPIGKYQQLYQHLLQHGVPEQAFYTPNRLPPEQLLQVHDANYVQQLCTGQLPLQAMRRIGFPWSEALIERSLYSVGGTLLTAQLALQHGLALHLSGGYHHAFVDAGSGFCLFNDLALTAATLLQQGVDKILIFDCDVHQGDGTALIFQHEPRVITASLHAEKNFPARKQRSDWDLGFAIDVDDASYTAAVQESLDYLLALHQPDLVIYDAGVDIHQDDELGLLNISTAGLHARDSYVISRCLALNIPLAAVIGGGYQRDLARLTTLHFQLFQAAFSAFNHRHRTA